MYLSNVDDYGSRGSLHCSTGPPVTPDSVVGTNILLEGNGNGNGNNNIADDHKSRMPSTDRLAHDVPSPELTTIFKTESADQYQVAPSYLHSSILIQAPRDCKDQGVSERCRRRTCEWMYDICDYFQLNREVVGIALFYVDRYFTIAFEGGASGQVQVPVTRRRFQLVALTGLYIAVKLHGESRQANVVSRQSSPTGPHPRGTSQPWNRLKFSLAVCASISRNQFTPREIEACEVEMLRTLDWHVNPIVSSGAIIDALLMYLPSTSNAMAIGGRVDESLILFVYDCAKYLAELSVSVPALSLVHKPSVIAYASVLYSLDTFSSKSGPCSSLLSEQGRREYEKLIVRASSRHFEEEKENVESAKKILRSICPNLIELFPPPSLTPKSPISVKVP
ncbi:hypothetical protein ACHAWF_012765 [Thalassiosira exigua]